LTDPLRPAALASTVADDEVVSVTVASPVADVVGKLLLSEPAVVENCTV
jgi:hypothetical protein